MPMQLLSFSYGVFNRKFHPLSPKANIFGNVLEAQYITWNCAACSKMYHLLTSTPKAVFRLLLNLNNAKALNSPSIPLASTCADSYPFEAINGFVIPARAIAPKNVRGTAPEKETWSQLFSRKEDAFWNDMPCVAISWVAWMLKDSSTLVYGATIRWTMMRAGIRSGRITSSFKYQYASWWEWTKDGHTYRMHLGRLSLLLVS